MQATPRPHILLGVSGSVAAIKVEELVHLLSEVGSVRVVATEAAQHFFEASRLPAEVTTYADETEWRAWSKKGDPVLHIELRKWADVFVIAPLSANTLAKLATGLCDNLLTSVARAWDFTKPMLVAPAMNTQMWLHPVTAPQLAVLGAWGVRQVPPVSKTLACGDTGLGAMAAPANIAAAVRAALSPAATAVAPAGSKGLAE